ncbi:hypothetical protein [Gloeobacter morelensis]|nr:hypothetical protein [Gloeobacter morelensis]
MRKRLAPLGATVGEVDFQGKRTWVRLVTGGIAIVDPQDIEHRD